MHEKIDLSPLTRLTMTFDRELDLDSGGALGDEAYAGYKEQHQISITKRDSMAKSLVLVNTVLFLLINGKGWKIPWMDADISTLPAIKEIVLLYSSLCFFFLCISFVNEQCYAGLVGQYGIRKSRDSAIDPDFVNASKVHYDFFLKIYRPKMNIWGIDFFESRRPFTILSRILVAMTVGILLLFPVIHFLLIFLAALKISGNDWIVWGKVFFFSVIALVNISGLVMVWAMLKDFSFDIFKSRET